MANDEIFFKWLPEYSVNIKTIDDQHQELVNILNRLFVAVSRREGDKAVAGILDALTSYTRTHFALEERLMREAKYQDLIPHMEEHRKLIAQLDELCNKHVMEERPIYFEMLSFLKSWLLEHIQKTDRKYGPFLRDKGVA